MAAPVGHIVCAIAFLNSGNIAINDHNKFFAGTNLPDIRYITDIRRATTHKMEGEGLGHIFEAPNAFEAGRRYHVFVDIEREKFMRERDAYRFVKNGPLRTQMLKMVEDHILFDKLKGRFDAEAVFSRIYDEERNYGISDDNLQTWHRILTTYLDQSSWFNFPRYYRSLMAFQSAYGLPNEFFGNFWQSVKTLGFLVYAYFQVEMLSRNPELRKIVLDFYEKEINNIIDVHVGAVRKQTVDRSPPSRPLFAGRALEITPY